MNNLVARILFSSLSLAAQADAEDAALPSVVPNGFQEFQKHGALAAMTVWLAGSARDTDDDQDQATSKMERIQSSFGRMLGYEIIRLVVLSPSTKRIYAAVKLEKGALECLSTATNRRKTGSSPALISERTPISSFPRTFLVASEVC